MQKSIEKASEASGQHWILRGHGGNWKWFSI